MRPWWPKARALAAAFVPLAAAACSAIISHADSQCATDGDCAKFPGTACVRGGCLPAPADAGTMVPDGSDACTTTNDCLRRHPAEDWVCRHADGVCVNLKSTDCTQVLGDYTDDGALVLGALVPLFGPHTSTGAALTGAIRLAVSDFSLGIPSPNDAGAPRALAVVVCNESNGVSRPATHLIADVQVPAILGTADGATTIDLVSQETEKSGVLVMSPRATPTTLAAQAARQLFWRTCPSDDVESKAIAKVTGDVVAPAVLSQNPQLTTVKVALLHATDVTSFEMFSKVESALVVNGKPATQQEGGNVVTADFGDPDDPNANLGTIYNAAVAAATTPGSVPDIIVLIGSTQAVTDVLTRIEDALAGSAKPRYVLSSGLQTTELLTELLGKEDLRGRILGTAPGDNDGNRTTFLAHYRNSVTDSPAPEIFGTAQMYDAVYTLAFAAAATQKATFTGSDLGHALRRLVGPSDAGSATPVTIGTNGIKGAFAAIAAGQTLAIDGASAPLAFDVTDTVLTDVQVWCVAHGTGSSLVFQSAGLAYSASSSSLVGTVTACP
jgi:branched-chain amino acid transport system substrate-binding protein